MLIIIRSKTVKLRENSVESFAMHRLIDWQNKKGQGKIRKDRAKSCDQKNLSIELKLSSQKT